MLAPLHRARGLARRPSEPRLRVYLTINSVRESRVLEELEVHSSWAFTRRSYQSVLIPKDGRPAVEESGKYLEILKQDGSVEVLEEHLEQ